MFQNFSGRNSGKALDIPEKGGGVVVRDQMSLLEEAIQRNCQNIDAPPKRQSLGPTTGVAFVCNGRTRSILHASGSRISPYTLEGPNRQSPIASVQRTLSTLADHSASSRGTNTTPTNANHAIRIAVQRMQGLRGPNSVFLGVEMTANERWRFESLR